MNIEKQAHDIIHNYLKENKIKYEINNSDNDITIYTLFIGSEEANIQLEYSKDMNDDELTAQFWIGDSFDPVYACDVTDPITRKEDIEEYLSQLLDVSKKYTRLIAKLEFFIDKMKYEVENSDLDIDFDLTVDDILKK